MSLEIRQENKNDYKVVFEINREAFDRDNEARLVDLLRNSEAFIPSLSIVAESDNKVVGHILFTKIIIQSDEGNKRESLALAPVAVAKDFQKKGIGGKMIRYGLAKAKEIGYKSVIVLGHEHYYPKFGFLPADKWNIKAPFDVPSEVFMAIELTENGLQNSSGTVHYPKEFEMV